MRILGVLLALAVAGCAGQTVTGPDGRTCGLVGCIDYHRAHGTNELIGQMTNAAVQMMGSAPSSMFALDQSRTLLTWSWADGMCTETLTSANGMIVGYQLRGAC